MEIAWPESPGNRSVALVASSFSVVFDLHLFPTTAVFVLSRLDVRNH